MKDAKLIYFGDPMCSWCWGIANHLADLKSAFEGQLGFEIVMGGLRNGSDGKWDDELKGFLRKHWEHVHEASGQPFNYDLLEKDSFDYDTEPSCRAVRVVRDMAPEKEFPFLKAVQEHFYVGNEDPNKLQFYAPLCNELALNFADFSAKFESVEYEQKVQQDFMKAQQFGIKGYPSIVLMTPEQGYLIASGYATFEELKKRLDCCLAKDS
jgi:putative protein-disulfide isomerase